MADFNSDWFSTIGKTIKDSMIFGSVFPIINELIMYGVRTMFRLLDRCRAKEGHSTSKTTIQQYINLMSGPQFFMHYKYSTVLNTIFITMTFGAGIPELFFIASVTILNLYLLEVFLLHYIYKCPPAYDEKLNKSALRILSFAPLNLLAFGYWMLSNKQLFYVES